MKIDNSLNATISPAGTRVTPQRKADSAAAPATVDDVKLSPLAGRLQAGDSQPPVDGARVEEIKRAISEGRFTINADAIAGRVIDTARQLLNSQRRA